MRRRRVVPSFVAHGGGKPAALFSDAEARRFAPVLDAVTAFCRQARDRIPELEYLPMQLVLEVAEGTVPARVAGASPVSLSGAAARFLGAQLAKHPGAVAVRLAVAPAGCSGFRYRVEPIERVERQDAVFECGGVRLAVDPLSLPYVQGTRIDLVREGLAQRLRYDNPNVRQSCGCGESFGV